MRRNWRAITRVSSIQSHTSNLKLQLHRELCKCTIIRVKIFDGKSEKKSKGTRYIDAYSFLTIDPDRFTSNEYRTLFAIDT